MLAALSVARRPLADPVLAEIAGVDEALLGGALHELSADGLLAPQTTDGLARPRHALLAEAVLDTLLPGERRLLHARTAEALRSTAEQSLAAEVAVHWSEAGRTLEELCATRGRRGGRRRGVRVLRGCRPLAARDRAERRAPAPVGGGRARPGDAARAGHRRAGGCRKGRGEGATGRAGLRSLRRRPRPQGRGSRACSRGAGPRCRERRCGTSAPGGSPPALRWDAAVGGARAGPVPPRQPAPPRGGHHRRRRRPRTRTGRGRAGGRWRRGGVGPGTAVPDALPARRPRRRVRRTAPRTRPHRPARGHEHRRRVMPSSRSPASKATPC